MGRVIQVEMVDGAGTRRVTVDSNGHGNTGAIFFSLEQARQAYAANRSGEPLRQDLVDGFAVNGIIVHDEDCDWW